MFSMHKFANASGPHDSAAERGAALLASAWFLHFLTVASTAAAQQPASAEQAFCQGHPDRPRKGERENC